MSEAERRELKQRAEALRGALPVDIGAYASLLLAETQQRLEQVEAERDALKHAIEDVGIVNWTLTDANADDYPRQLYDAVTRVVQMAADPAVSEVAADNERLRGLVGRLAAPVDKLIEAGAEHADYGQHICSCSYPEMMQNYAIDIKALLAEAAKELLP